MSLVRFWFDHAEVADLVGHRTEVGDLPHQSFLRWCVLARTKPEDAAVFRTKA